MKDNSNHQQASYGRSLDRLVRSAWVHQFKPPIDMPKRGASNRLPPALTTASAAKRLASDSETSCFGRHVTDSPSSSFSSHPLNNEPKIQCVL